MALITRFAARRLGVLSLVLIALGLIGWWFMIRMPGESWKGPLPSLTEKEKILSEELRQLVAHGVAAMGERNVFQGYEALERTARFIESTLTDMGYQVNIQTYEVLGKRCENLEVEVHGSDRSEEIILVGAHYDSVSGSPGANDNGSGYAAALALARMFYGKPLDTTLRFVFFVNEEPPFFQTEQMGSLVYARRCRERGEQVKAMLALETMGYYSDQKGSQAYPPPLGLIYPSTGNFIAFVGNVRSMALVRNAVGLFRKHAAFPSEGGALPGILPGVSWSDHWSFWKAGYPGVMVTDTAPFRYPHYHRPSDTPDRLDYERLARVVAGLEKVVAEWVGL
jgi:hypothetical protein